MNRCDFKVRYHTKDNKEIVGILRLPQKDNFSEIPVVILAHGFCSNKNENGLFTKAADVFCERGYASLRFDFRGCGESKGSFREVRLNDNVHDIRATVNFIRSSNYNLDKKRICFVGFSLGATIGLLSNCNFFVTAFWAPAFFPVNDMFPRYETREVKEEIESNGFLRKTDLEVSPEFIRDLGQCTTASILRRYKTPCLIVHGLRDQRINYRSSNYGYEIMNLDKDNKKFFQIKGASHSFKDKEKMREKVIRFTVDWFNEVYDRSEHERSGILKRIKNFSIFNSIFS